MVRTQAEVIGQIEIGELEVKWVSPFSWTCFVPRGLEVPVFSGHFPMAEFLSTGVAGARECLLRNLIADLMRTIPESR
jgi:hypothetical protein